MKEHGELEEATLGARDAVLALLHFEELSYPECGSDESLEFQQEQLCRSLLRSLQRLKTPDDRENAQQGSVGVQGQFIRTSIRDYNNKSEQDKGEKGLTVSIREILPNLPSATISKIPTILSSFLTQRVDTDALLPATQDDRANEEAMGMTAITITKLSMIAAQLYVELIGMPGAWAAGMIDVGAVSSLAALMRRWCVECCGREPRDKGYVPSKRKSSTFMSSLPVKRCRTKNARMKEVADIDDDFSECDLPLSSDEDGPVESATACDEDGAPPSTEDLIFSGLRVAHALGEVMCQNEFMNWSGEAREAFIDALVSSLATASALGSGNFQAQKWESSNDWVTLCAEVEVSLSQSLQNWVLTSTIEADYSEVDGKRVLTKKQHDTSVYMLRSLFPFLSMQTELPHGQRGKQEAYDVAVSTLEGFIRRAASESSKWSLEPRSGKSPRSRITPRHSATKLSALGVSTPLTSRSRKEGKKRVSFGSGNTSRVQPPTLKKSATPRRRLSHFSGGESTPSIQGQQPRPVLSVILGLFQKLSTSKGLERAKVRARVIATLLLCLPALPFSERSHFLKFVIQLCHSKISVHRLFGAELVGKILVEKWLWVYHASHQVSSPRALWSNVKTPSTRRGSLSPLVKSSEEDMPLALVGALHGRLTDKTPAVRARSAFSLSETLRNFSDGEVDIESGDDSWTAFEQAICAIGNDMLASLRTRAARDERATVKKAAASALVELLVLGETFSFTDDHRICISETDVSVLRTLCGDQFVATRKAAADALTSLLQRCYYNGHCSVEAAVALEHAWSSAVLPLALDTESSCAEKAACLFSSIVLDPLIEVGGYEAETDSDLKRRRYMMAWRILAHASESSRQQGAARGESGSLRAVLKKRFSESGSDEKNISKKLLMEIRRVAINTREIKCDSSDAVPSLFGDDVEARRIGVWCLFDAFVDCHVKNLPKLAQIIERNSIDMGFLVTSWEMLLELSTSPQSPDHSVSSLQESTRSCLGVLSKLALLVNEENASTSIDKLKELLGSFELVPDLISSAIAALVALTRTRVSSEEVSVDAMKECSYWIRKMYTKCQSSITTYLSKVQNKDNISAGAKEVVVSRALFTIGELSLVGFRSDEDAVSRKEKSKLCNEFGSVVGLHESPSKHLCSLVQALLPKSLPASEVCGEGPILTPEAVRAHAFTALGKLCLRDEDLAKHSLTILARELDPSEMTTAVKSNALLVLGDLCVKYTNLVDRYLPVMAACLQAGKESQDSGSALVRRHAVLMLSSLLLQDYVKWRGLMFHRYLVASADDDEGVAELAETLICGPLLQKFPKLFSNNFVESLFVLNRCTAHPIYTSAAMAGESGGGVAVGFDGIELRKAQRLHIYEMMLSHMTDEEKIGATARLAKDILGGALVESDGDLGKVCRRPPNLMSSSTAQHREREQRALNVVSDAFAILTSPSLRVGKIRGDNEILDAEPSKTSHMVEVKGRLLSKISRKHLIEIVLPILCNLKTVLQESSSPLLKDLMRYMVDMFCTYRAEVVEFLANDPTLLQEVEYDANQFKKQAQKSPEEVIVVQ